MYACNHEQVALFKLSEEADREDSIEEEYQEYIIRKDITKTIYNEYEEYQFIERINKYEKVKNNDKETCELTLQYNSQIISAKSSLDTFENLNKNLNKHLEMLKKKYDTLIVEFPNSLSILELYASFFNSIYNNSEEYSFLNFRKKFIIDFRNNSQSTQKSAFSEENPYFLISASTLNIGKIVFSNPSMSDLLNIPLENLINTQVMQYFPKEFEFLKPQELKKFKSNLIDTTTYFSERMVLLNNKGLLVEVTVKMILVGSINPIYLCICIPTITTRAVAIITKQGNILNCSENLMEIFMIDLKLEDNNITSIVSCSSFESLKRTKELVININKHQFTITYSKIHTRGTAFRYIQVYNK